MDVAEKMIKFKLDSDNTTIKSKIGSSEYYYIRLDLLGWLKENKIGYFFKHSPIYNIMPINYIYIDEYYALQFKLKWL